MAYRKEIIVVCIFSTILLFVVATYAYFTSEVSSTENAFSASTAKFSLSLEVNSEYFYNKLIPMDDSLALTGYANECVDMYNYNVCQSYKITIGNTAGTGQHERLLGVINFDVTKIKNLSYMLLDEDGNVYQDITAIVDVTDLPLGEFVELDDGESKTFTLIIWLSNVSDKDQTGDDANGSFTASVTYTGVRGQDLSTTITGTIN